MGIWQRVLPETVNNDYQGGKVAIYGLVLLMFPLTFRALVHLLKDDSGVNSIATIVLFGGDPDPNNVVYLFSSLWGGQQLVFVCLLAIVLVRYRALIPMMYALLVAEMAFRFVSGSLHPLTPEYYASRPPGAVGTLPMLIYVVTMLFFSLSSRKPQAAQPD